MSYIVEPFDGLLLNLSEGPFVVPAPLSIELEFVWISYPELPWSRPSLTAEYAAPLFAANVANNRSRLPLTPSAQSDGLHAALWASGAGANHSVSVIFQTANISDADSKAGWDEGSTVESNQTLRWKYSATADNRRTIAWGDAIGSDHRDFVSSWIMNTPFSDAAVDMGWFSVNMNSMVYDDAAELLALLNTDGALTINLDGTGLPAANESATKIRLQFGLTKSPRPIVPHDVTKRLNARKGTPVDTRRAIPWGAGTSVWNNWNLPYPVDNGPPIPPDPVDPPIRKVVYLIMNTLSVIDLETSTPLDIQNVTIGLDIDSISWKFSGTVHGQATLDLIAPDKDGMKDIEVTINGHSWIFSIEKYTSDEKFPTQKFTVTGLSRTQYMAVPHAPVSSYTNASTLTAIQACEAVLENTGFTLDWHTGDDGDLPDWMLLSGALSYRDKSPSQVISQIVSAAGGVLIPSMASDSWKVQQRYTTPPWQWETVTPDAAIYIGMVRSRAASYEAGQAYDACYVSGINQGVAVDVHLTGSGGLNPMPDIFDDLITAPQPAISRGRNELGESGNKVVETLSVLIPEAGAAPGILIPGMIVSITHDNPDRDYIALVLANSISVQRAGGAEIFQNVTLERNA